MDRYHHISLSALIALAVLGKYLCPSVAAPSASPALPVVPGYTATDLATLGEGVKHVLGENGAGQLVGNYRIGGATHGFLWDRGRLVDLGTLGGKHSEVTSVNAFGQVVGMSWTASGEYDGFLWQDGRMQDLGLMEPIRINNLGQVLALSFADRQAGHPVLWEKGTTTDLGTLGGRSTDANDLNDLGQVVGASLTKDNIFHAFLWKNGSMMDLGTLGAGNSFAFSINNLGEVVGDSVTTSGAGHAFLWREGRMTDLGPADSRSSRALFMNDVGQIIGLTEADTPPRSSPLLWERGQTGSVVLPGLDIYKLYGLNNGGQILLETQSPHLNLLLTPTGGKSLTAQETMGVIEGIRALRIEMVAAGKSAPGQSATVITAIIVPDLDAAVRVLERGFTTGAIGELKAVLRLITRYTVPATSGTSERISRLREMILRLGGDPN